MRIRANTCHGDAHHVHVPSLYGPNHDDGSGSHNLILYNKNLNPSSVLNMYLL